MKINAKKIGLAILCSVIISQVEAKKWSDVLTQAGGVLQQLNDVAQQMNSVQNSAGNKRPSLVNYNGMYDEGPFPIMTVNADQNALNRGFFIDPLTNLTWSRCPVPMTWNGSKCVGEPVYAVFNYKNALTIVKEMNAKNYAGYSDWRLPTMNEVLLTTYGTTESGQKINKQKVRGIDIWKNKLITVGDIINGECTVGCTWGNPWTSTNRINRGSHEFAYLNLSRTDLYGDIYDREEMVETGKGIDYVPADSYREADSTIIRLVRGGNGPQDNGLSDIKQYQNEQLEHSKAYNEAFDKATEKTKQCQQEQNEKWRQDIQVGHISDKGGVVAVNGPLITVNLKDGSFKNFARSKLENPMINALCMKHQVDVMKQFETK